MQTANDLKSGTKKKKSRATPGEYGVLESRNIGKIVFGEYEFESWYGNSAYFHANGDLELGIDSFRRNSNGKKNGTPRVHGDLWILTLHVCEFCFKYTADENKMTQHRTLCEFNKPYPSKGKLVYSDMKAPYLIKKVRGSRHELFCQNLSLFGKLFLDDKSVYYNVEAFDFYILYGFDSHDVEVGGSVLRKPFKPMGFFSKEVNSWEADNNLACICMFPPYQRLHLGSLLIEFLYALAAVTCGQALLGPEFPLSPFGKLTYLRFWSKRLATVLTALKGKSFSLCELADETGFRKEDILMTLENMDVLQQNGTEVVFVRQNLQKWCRENNVNGAVQASMLNPQCLLL